ncbi:MAG: hypothetical protein HOY76_39835 [Streptomyces sp.]|nr:hypothetical protein [Streptomyces sp.]
MTETRRRTPATPAALADPPRNHGVAFTQQERDALGLTGRLPSGVLTLDQQARRAYQQMHAQGGDLAKNVYLEQLHDRNETLYFKVLSDHLAELLPIVYDPTVGEAIEKRPQAVADQVDATGPGASLLPPVENLRESSAITATAVVKAALDEGVATSKPTDAADAVRDAMWQPAYTAGAT